MDNVEEVDYNIYGESGKHIGLLSKRMQKS
jgi:hypothetical protein